MRRHLTRYLPVFMIALMVQIAAPIGACLAVAVAAADPLAAAEICHSNSATTPVQNDQGGEHRAHDGACAICCVLNASAAAVNTPSPIGVIAPYRVAEVVVWHRAARRVAAIRSGSNAQARAPPVSM